MIDSRFTLLLAVYTEFGIDPISNYRYNNISKQCEALHLTTVYTGVDMDYSFAMREGDTELYSIISKVTNLVPDSTIHAALTYYST